MTIFDLVFLLVAFATLVSLLIAVGFAVAGRFQRALRLLMMVAMGVGVYMTVVVLVSVLVPRRVMQADAYECFDDWCISVAGATRQVEADSAKVSVDMRLFSRARRISQRENNLQAYLTDAQNRRYEPVADASSTPFNVLLHPGESVLVKRTFVVPSAAKNVGLVVTHEGGFPIAWFIIGYDAWFRKPAVFALPS